MKTQDRLKSIKPESIVGAVLSISLIFLVLFLVIRSIPAAPVVEEEATLEDLLNQGPTYIEVTNPNAVFFNNKKVNLPDGWVVKAHFQEINNNGLSCVVVSGKSACEIYEIENNGIIFYASSPAIFKEVNLSIINEIKEKVKLFEVDADLTFEQTEVVSREDNTEGGASTVSNEIFIKQAYICNANKICFSTGKLSLDLTRNKSQYALFKTLISSVKSEDI